MKCFCLILHNTNMTESPSLKLLFYSMIVSHKTILQQTRKYGAHHLSFTLYEELCCIACVIQHIGLHALIACTQNKFDRPTSENCMDSKQI